MECRKRELDSDDEEELRAFPKEEQRLSRRTKVLRWYVPTQTVVKRPAAVEESNVAMRAWLGVSEGAARVIFFFFSVNFCLITNRVSN